MCGSASDKENYEKIINVIPGIICITYLDGSIKYANQTFNDILGYSMDEVKELNIFSMIHPDDKDSAENSVLSAVREQRNTVCLKYRYKCRNGNYKWISWNTKIDWDEKLVYRVGSEVSCRKEMEQAIEESSTKFKSIFEQSPIAVALYDKQGQLIMMNKTCFDLYGFVDAEDSKNINLFTTPQIPQNEKDILHKGIPAKFENDYNFDVTKQQNRFKTTKSGSITLDWVVTPLINKVDEITGFMAQMQDITELVNKTNKIKQQNYKLEAIIENMSDALFVFDKDGNYTTYNKSARDMFATLGKSINRIGDSYKENVLYYDIYGDLMEYEKFPAVRTLRGEKISAERVVMKDHDVITYYDVNSTPIYDDEGNFIAGIQCWDNVTEQVLYEKILKEQFYFLNKMIDTMDLAFIRLSYPELEITDLNKKALNILGGLKPEINTLDIVKELKISDLIADFDKDNFMNHFQHIKEKKETSYSEHRKLIVSGQELFVNVLYQPIMGLKGDIKEVAAIIIDLTKETKANCELEKNIKMQEEFFLNISHELKTPLNVIFSTIQLLDLYIKNDSFEENQHKIEKYINIIRQNCYRQSKLVNNIVDLSKIESGFFQLHLSNQNIVKVVEEIVQSVSEYVKDKGLNIVFDTDMEEKIIACDLGNMERVMLNLISNAIKFSKAGGEITVDVLDKGGSVEISVKDTGIGIDKDNLETIFERFKQVDKSLSRKAEGSGIGLCLVKSIVELQGGKVYVESEPGNGSKFTIELPNRTVEVPYQSNGGNKIKSKVQTINTEFSDIYSL